jgi:hypothetical protein
MFKKILIANRGENAAGVLAQPNGAAGDAQPNGAAGNARQGD